MDQIKIGKYIAGKRKELGMTQKQLAEKLGMSDKSVSKWERGICLPDVSVYIQLCEILGISINEFLVGEDIRQEDMVKKSEDNLIQIATDSKYRQKNLKKIIAILLVVAVFAVTIAGIMIYRIKRPSNCIYPVNRNSAEMKTAELLSGVDGAFLYRYTATDSYKVLTIYISTYQSGKRISKDKIEVTYGDTGSPTEGMIAIVPDFENFTVKLVIADDSTKQSTNIPILENVKNREYYGRSATQIEETKQITYNKEQSLAALLYGENGLEGEPLYNFEENTPSQTNDYAYYFSFEFNK